MSKTIPQCGATAALHLPSDLPVEGVTQRECSKNKHHSVFSTGGAEHWELWTNCVRQNLALVKALRGKCWIILPPHSPGLFPTAAHSASKNRQGTCPSQCTLVSTKEQNMSNYDYTIIAHNYSCWDSARFQSDIQETNFSFIENWKSWLCPCCYFFSCCVSNNSQYILPSVMKTW